MDRINGAGHVGRRFVAEDADLGRPPTLITDAWLNSVQEEIVNVILAAGGALDGGQEDQLLQAINDLIQAASNAFVSVGGTADAITATYAPVVAALTHGMTVYVRAASANATTTPTFTPASGVIAATTIVKGAGAALSIGDIAGAGHWLELQYDATSIKWVLQNPATGVSISAASIIGAFKNLKINALGVNNYNCAITADEVVLENSNNAYLTVRAVNKTINANGAVGAPLSIMSARAASTWYYRWLWYNATNGLTATLDTSSTAPTAPTGYSATDYKAKLPGACRTDASGGTYLLQISTQNWESSYIPLAGSNLAALPQMASGAAGNISTPTWIAIGTGNYIPSTASMISVLAAHSAVASGCIIAAPNNSYGPSLSITNPPPIDTNANGGNSARGLADMAVESTNIYWASVLSTSALFCRGWEDVV
ncbi:MAG: hypothetical protein WBK19_16380 [Azonexus sp.]